MTPRFYRVAFFAFAGVWAFSGVLSLSHSDYAQAGIDLALSVAWLLVALFRDRLAPRSDALLERQRARVEGFGAHSFQPDSDSRPPQSE